MTSVEPNYTDPLEAAVAAELIESRPGIAEAGAWAGAHIIVSAVDAAFGTTWPPSVRMLRRARSRLTESADRAVRWTLGESSSPIRVWLHRRATTGLQPLDTDDVAARAAAAVRAAEPPPQVTA